MRATIKDIRLHYENGVITYIFLLGQISRRAKKLSLEHGAPR